MSFVAWGEAKEISNNWKKKAFEIKEDEETNA